MTHGGRVNISIFDTRETRVPFTGSQTEIGEGEWGETKQNEEGNVREFEISRSRMLFSLEWHTSRRKLLLSFRASAEASDVIVCILREQISR